MNTIKKGNITELRVQLKLVELGYHVLTPITDGCSVDLIFLDSNGLSKRVQVKKSKETKTGFVFDGRKSIGSHRVKKEKYSVEEIDLFATIFNDELYLIPIQDCMERGRILLRFNEDYTNQNEPMYAKDYLVR